MSEDKVACGTPNPGRSGVVNIPAWKFDAVRAAVLKAVSDGPMTIGAVRAYVADSLPSDIRDKLGSLNWHVTTVRLEMERRGELERLPKSRPMTIRRATPAATKK